MEYRSNILDTGTGLTAGILGSNNQSADANHPAAAAAARAKLEQIHSLNPNVTPNTIIQTSVGLAPKPFSPTERQMATTKKANPRLKRTRPIIGAIMSFVFLFAFFKSQVLLSQIKYATSKPNPAAIQPVVTTAPVGAQSVIIIPKLNINAPIIYEPSIEEAKIQKSLESGVVHYGNTPVSGQGGNNVIVGHSSNDWWEPGNYKFVFVLLDKLVPGDTITVNYQSKQYVYNVTEVKVVEPTDLSVLTPTPEPTLTLITCTPPGTSYKRLIIRAKQTSPDTSKLVQTTTSAPSTPTQTLPSNAPSLLDQLGSFWRNLFGAHKAQDTTSPTPQTAPAGGLPTAK